MARAWSPALLAAVLLVGPACGERCPEDQLTGAPERIYAMGKSTLVLTFVDRSVELPIGPVAEDELQLSVRGQDALRWPSMDGGASAFTSVQAVGPRTIDLVVNLVEPVGEDPLRLEARLPRFEVCGTAILRATATRLARAPSGEGFCCPTGGNCNRYYTGGWVPRDDTGCGAIADARGPVISSTDAHGCPVVNPTGFCNTRP